MQHTTSKFDESLPTTEKLDYGNGAARRTPVVKRVASKFWHWRWRNITVYLCVAALLAIIGIAAWLAYRFVQSHSSVDLATHRDACRAEANNANFTQIIDEGQEVDGLVMYGRVISIDLAALSVAISWSLFGSGTFTSPDKALFSEDGVLLGLAMETVNVVCSTCRSMTNEHDVTTVHERHRQHRGNLWVFAALSLRSTL